MSTQTKGQYWLRCECGCSPEEHSYEGAYPCLQCACEGWRFVDCNIAPELLAILERLLGDVDAINDNDALLVAANRSGWGDRVTETMIAARAICAKARGEG